MGAHYGALASEMVRRDFGEAQRSLGHVEPVIGIDHN
jgi:hypothetical protein